MNKIPKHFRPVPYEYHQEIQIKIDTITNEGLGLGRDNNWVVMAPFTLPGELVRVRIFRNHSNYSLADLVEVIEPSPQRVGPKCDLFTQCGGCQYQHLSYLEQLIIKQKQVEAALCRIGGLEIDVLPTVASPNKFYYRSKLTPHYPGNKVGEDYPIGFHYVGSRRRLVDVAECPIATKAINAALPLAREEVKAVTSRKRGGTLLLRDAENGVFTHHKDIVSEKVGELELQFTAGDFFQNNPFLLTKLVRYVIGKALESSNYLIDAYCGVGLFALYGASKFKQVLGVEVNARAITWANKNRELNAIKNCDFIVGKAEAVFEVVDFPSGEATVIIDPPRGGCDLDFIKQLVAYKPQRIVYVSCEPTTQARDLQRLRELGKYEPIECQPFDMFPQTKHIENVVTLLLG